MRETRPFLTSMLIIVCCLLLLLSAGCGDDEEEGVAPGISNLFFAPASAVVFPRSGELGVTVSMDYVDPDGDIAFVRMSFRVCGEGEVRHEDIPPGGITGNQAGEIWISTRVPTDCPAGAYLFEFSVFDQKGHQSNTLEATLALTTSTGGSH